MPFWGGVLGRIKNWFIGFPEGAAKSEFDVTPAISREMMTEINLWYSLYVGQAPWVTRDVVSLNIPASICRELARPTLSELEVLRASILWSNWLPHRSDFNRLLRHSLLWVAGHLNRTYSMTAFL